MSTSANFQTRKDPQMKTNFAFIDECAEQAIANYTPVTEAVPLAGFMVQHTKE